MKRAITFAVPPSERRVIRYIAYRILCKRIQGGKKNYPKKDELQIKNV